MDWKEILGKDFGVKLQDAMAKLANGIGVAAEHLYIVLVKQQLIDGIVTAIGCLIGMIVLGIFVWKVSKYLIKSNQSEYIALMLFPAAGFILCMIFFFIGIKHIINPEYYAIHEIMDTIKGE
jgi:hypothetical protein